MIPHEAIEAAAKALSDNWDAEGEHTKAALRHDAQAALEAAAPHILAEASRDARDELAAVIEAGYGEDPSACPYDHAPVIADAILAAGYRKPTP